MGGGRDSGGVNDDVLQLARQRTDQFRALDRQNRHDLLETELRLATRQGSATGPVVNLVLDLIASASPSRSMRPAM